MLRWLWLPFFALAFAPTGMWLVERGTASAFSEAHTIFMPFVVAYLVREQLKLDPDPAPRASALGFLFLVPALVLLALDAAIKTRLLSAIALVIALPGISLLLLGTRRTRELAFPLAIAIFIIPIPAGMLTPIYSVLRPIAAIGSSWIVPLFGVSIARVGTALTVPNVTVEVANNCGGWSTLQAAVITALVLAHFSTSRRRRLALLLGAVPLAIFCNILRVSALVLLANEYGAKLLETKLHPASGVVLFGVVIAALFAIAGSETMRVARATGERTAVSDRFSLALAFLCALALLPVAVHANARLRSDDCANSAALVPVEGVVDPERAAFMEEQFAAVQWREGVLPPNGDSPALRFAVIRSYEPRLLYYRGSRRLWREVEQGGDTVEWLESDDGRLPIVRSRPQAERPDMSGTVIASLLVYEDEPVETGWWAQLRSAPRQVLMGSRPMTMFTVRGDVRPDKRAAAEQRAREFLLDSWRTYRAVCRS
jgi:exosortase